MSLETRSVHPMAAQPEDDAAIIGQVLRGDVARFEVLMRRHNQRVFRTARAILRDDAEAEDASQQAWLSAYQHLAQWDRRARFSTWLTRIVVHAAIRRRHSAAAGMALRLVASDGKETETISLRPSPEDEAARVQARALLERAIDALPESSRVVVVLRDLEELSSAETADALGLTEEAVRVRLHRARKVLRETIEETLAANAGDLFPFLGARCDRIVEFVLRQIGSLA